MAGSPWFERLQGKLVERDLPQDYVRRFMEELSDHFQDLMEETMGTDTDALDRLGEPQEVANAAAIAYRHRSFVGRHCSAALLVFVVSPVVTLALSALAVLLVLIKTAAWLEVIGDGASSWGAANTEMLSSMLKLITIVIPSLVLAVVYCRLVERYGIGRKWMITSCVVLALLAAAAGVQLTLPEASGQGRVSLSLGFSVTDTVRLLQLLTPLVVGWWFLRGDRDASRAAT